MHGKSLQGGKREILLRTKHAGRSVGHVHSCERSMRRDKGPELREAGASKRKVRQNTILKLDPCSTDQSVRFKSTKEHNNNNNI